MGLTQSTAPTTEPVTLVEARAQARVDITTDDDFIWNIVKSARDYLEGVMERQFCTATWQLTLDVFPAVFYLPRPPLSSVTSITYVDTAGASQTLASSVYTVLTDRQPGQIVEAYDQNYPSTRSQPNAVTVTYVAGYGAPASVPAGIKQAIMLIVSHWYENREAILTGTISKEIDFAVEALIWRYRSFEIANA